ncbi:MAG: GDSL-type esterase/lipase family protein [Clostridiales bacterium]|nr:GDSL-type esterase/lipase family protein [Clostridiales bacterium]
MGDSITYGHGIKNWSKNNYPAVLEKLLGSDYDVQNFGASGRAVQGNSDRPYTNSKQYRMSLDYNADIVIFMMGTNDSKPENWHGEEAFKSAAEALIESYENQENKPEIYICIPSKAYFTDDKNGSLTNYDIHPEIV